MTYPAIGYLRSDISGARQPWDEIQMRTLAGQLGYRLVKTVVFSQFTVDVDQLIDTVTRADAIAVVVPSIDHFEGGIPRAVLGVANVIAVDTGETHAAPLPNLFHSSSTDTSRGGEHT